jgi:hypothetical protein
MPNIGLGELLVLGCIFVAVGGAFLGIVIGGVMLLKRKP